MKDKIIEILNREIYLEEGSVRTSEIGVGGFEKVPTEITQLLTTESETSLNVGAEEMIGTIVKLDLIYVEESSEMRGVAMGENGLKEVRIISEHYDKKKAELLNQFASKSNKIK